MNRLNEYSAQILNSALAKGDEQAQQKMVDLIGDFLALTEAVNEWRGNPTDYKEKRILTAHDNLLRYVPNK